MSRRTGNTIRAPCPLETCSDCGDGMVNFCHWGCVVPDGEIGVFCKKCMKDRYIDWCDGKPPKPIGYKIKEKERRAKDVV